MKHLTRRSLGVALASAGLSLALSAEAADAPKVKFVTNLGEFVIEVYPDKAPKTVDNFLRYVKDKHYDGTIFHRVIESFMIQGGGYDAKLSEKSTRPSIAHEGREALEKGGPKNVVGTVAMARTNDPNSATAQFFINVKDNAFLDPALIPAGDPVPEFSYRGQTYKNVPRNALVTNPALFGYTVFGKVVSGMETVEKIRTTPTGPKGPFPSDVPKETVVIQSATLVK